MIFTLFTNFSSLLFWDVTQHRWVISYRLLVKHSKKNVFLDLSEFYLFTNRSTSDCLKNSIKIYIKIAPICFGAVTPSSGSALVRAY